MNIRILDHISNTMVDAESLTARIQAICYSLEHHTFLSAQDREKLLIELKQLVEQRRLVLEALKTKDE